MEAIRQLKQFVATVKQIAVMQKQLQEDDNSEVGAQIIDWQYIVDWAENLIQLKRE